MQRTALVVMPSGVSEERSGGCMRTRSALAGALRTSHASCRRRARFCTIEHGARRGITEITFVTSSPVPKGRLDDSRGRSESLFHPYGRASPRNAGQEALGSRHWPSVTGSSPRRPTTPGTRHKCRGDQTRRALHSPAASERNDPRAQSPQVHDASGGSVGPGAQRGAPAHEAMRREVAQVRRWPSAAGRSAARRTGVFPG